MAVSALCFLNVGQLPLSMAGKSWTPEFALFPYTIGFSKPSHRHRHLSLSAPDSISVHCNSTSLSEGGSASPFSVTSSTKFDVDYLGQSTRGDLNVDWGSHGAALEGPIEEVARVEAQEAEDLLRHLGIPGPYSARHSPRGIFCSRTLNLRSIGAIGYDMDYTLMHYNVMFINMSNGIVYMCKFDEKTLVLSVRMADGFEHLHSNVIRRWNELGSRSFTLFYNLPNHPRCHLDNEEDFQNMCAVVQIMGIQCVSVDVVVPVSDMVIASGHPSEVGECSRAGTNDGGSDIFSSFCVHERKDMMTVGWDTLISFVGQIIEGGVKEARLMLRKMSLQSGQGFSYVRNEPGRVHVECSKKAETGCPWTVYLSKSSYNDFFYVKDFVKDHTCVAFVHSKKGPTSKLVASLFEDTLKDKGTLSPLDVKQQLSTSFGLSCTYDVAWNAVNAATDLVFGKDESSYSNIREYAKSLVSTNTGSHVVLDVDAETSRFRRIFVAFGACIEGYRFCLPLLFLDAAHLKHRFKGHILAANGLDGNSGLYTLCFAIVDSENDENWRWFLDNLRCCVDSSRTLSIISDRNPGLIAGVPLVFPHFHHAFCLWHLEMNLNDRLGRAKFSKPLKESIVYLFKQCAYAPTIELYNQKMRALIYEGKGVVADFVQTLSPDKWTNAHFKGMRYGKVCSSVAESFNAWISKERELNCTTMIERIRLKMMQHISDRMMSSATWTSDLCPEVDRTLIGYYNQCKSWNAIRSSPDVFEVICHPSVKVDVLNHTCSCHRWQLSGIPCEHAVLCIRKYGVDILKCVDRVFHAESYRRCYSFPMFPVPSLDICNVGEKYGVLPLARSKRMPGRPKKRRIKSRGESCARQMTCGRCKKRGNHNRSTCSEPLTQG